MKKCYTCKEMLSLSSFNKNKGKKDGLNTICKDCSRNRSRRYYQENTEHHKEVTRVRSRAYKEALKIKVNAFKIECVVCGEKETCCLDFHHIDPKTKDSEVSRMVAEYKPQKVFAEIAKCAVVCANCHRKVHANIIDLALYL